MKKRIVALAALTVVGLATMGVVAAAADPPAQDENWLMTSISGDRFEIAGGKIALSKASVPVVRSLARRLITDHTKSLHDAVQLAVRWGMKPPPSATPSQQWQLNRLRYTPNSRFDGQYTALEVKDHNQDIEETGFEARKGSAADIRREALKDLPMLNMHLRLSKAAAKAVTTAHASAQG
jgi:putative membrane protein